ncbi:tetratricopeptide repeat protein [Polycladidibacter hongkongensis]|uniref:tetratricopeptide repeat protein n=1 Tax=Polycladidibacter hongkongensis TaxID=1647556 RepID=UPI00082E4123|nr:tetratricopeptide repeat protein [Pseudovibrio hongkongensis]
METEVKQRAAEFDQALETAFVVLGGSNIVSAKRFLEMTVTGDGAGAALGLSDRMQSIIYKFAYQALHLGRQDEAAQLFQALCLMNPQNADHWLGLALSSEQWPNGSELVEAALRKAAKLDPDNPAIYLRLAEYFLWQRRPADAQAALNQRLRLLKPVREPAEIEFAKRLELAAKTQQQDI